MVTSSYNHNSSRAQKARFGTHLGRSVGIVELGLVGILTAGTLYLLLTHHATGWSVFGAGLLLTVAYIWHHWDLMRLEPNSQAIQAETVQLDAVVEQQLLSHLHPNLQIEELWQAALLQWEGVFMVRRLGLPHTIIADLLHQKEVAADSVWSMAIELARVYHSSEVDSGIVIAAVLASVSELQPVLDHAKLKSEDILSVLGWQQRVKRAIKGLSKRPSFGGIGRDWASGYTPLLNRFANNLSREVESGYYRTVPSVHEPVLSQVIEMMGEGKPVALVGNVGSGKTALMYAAAERILQADNVGKLKYYQIMSLNAGVLIASGAQLEDAVLQVLTEAAHAKNTIIFLDDAQLFFGSGTGAVDISQVLLPILQHGVVPMVMAMTEHDWQALTVKNSAFVGQLQRVAVAEPPEGSVVDILQDAAIGVEHKANAVVQYQAIQEAIRLAGRYLPEAAFPGKGITVLESAAHYAQDHVITAASVQQAVEFTTGAKVTAAAAPERQQLLKLEDKIHERMINQTRAVKVVSDALRRARAGVSNPRRPVGSFLFLGPTGVGKTELAKALAAIYYGGEEAMLRLDMSEYQQQSDVARLLASTSGSQSGATLASGVRQRPSTVVLLDEIEKAHPDILNLLLQMLDEGRLTDSDGRMVSFKDAIIIATSNAAADDIRVRIAQGQKLEEFESAIVEELISSHAFKPELLNRFDEIVVFRPLTKEELLQVVVLMMAEVNTTLNEQNIRVAITPAAAAWLVEHGYDPQLGARPLRRIVQRSVENLVAERILAGGITTGQTITFDEDDLAAAQSKV